eukprot:1721245-Prymnesium_polylepis.1
MARANSRWGVPSRKAGVQPARDVGRGSPGGGDAGDRRGGMAGNGNGASGRGGQAAVAARAGG